MGESIIGITSNFLYKVIYSVQDKEHGLKFPIEKIEQYLMTEGYKRLNLECNKVLIVMWKEGNKVFIGEKTICFEVLSEELKEKYNQKITSFIILRYKIFSDATLQNIESAKINLIQNKLRTCVSNMYYSLHNGISAMVEHYKLMDTNNLLENINEELDDEAFLGHFTPAALKVFLNNIDDICKEEKDEYLKNDKLKSGRMKSYNNPFSWIYPLFYDKIISFEDKGNELNTILEDMTNSIKDISLDNIAVDDTQKRSNFEKELKCSLEIVKEIINNDERNSAKYIIAVLSGYFSYAYMLRQLGDYDSLFEIKVKHKDIIRWTITSSQFIEIILKYLNINTNEYKNKIQVINARSSKGTLSELYMETELDLMTTTGIIIDRSFNLIDYIKKLHKKQGYTLFNQRNEIPNIDENSHGITLSKNISNTPYKCFISISDSGIFRLDIALSDYKDNGIRKTINTSYLEKFIYKEILEEDFQKLLSEQGSIVIGTSIIYENEKYSKLQLLVKTHEIIERRYERIITQAIQEIACELSSDKLLIVPCVYLFRDTQRIMGPYLRNRLSRAKLNFENFDKNIEIVFVMISDTDNFEVEIERACTWLIEKEGIENNINFQHIKMLDENIKLILQGDDNDIRSKFKNIIESYEINEGKEVIDILSTEDEYYGELENNNTVSIKDIAVTIEDGCEII
ncbi:MULTISPECIES: hypothetical protein [Clostridium]|uniref:hypothetical protein n=1 Tax=Clostridium TaxID=1485 RepID=UPI0008A15668|nr:MULTISPECIES: hypothetical protein [Clostridium]MBO1685972.1 hypothetical protein [Clostridium butyricum]MDU5101342.1 hypothetical protein [Clostridium butyricum]OFS25984.1 hypothetical protein HMPREF3070_01250 [Clostridium sp. HMSC19A10]